MVSWFVLFLTDRLKAVQIINLSKEKKHAPGHRNHTQRGHDWRPHSFSRDESLPAVSDVNPQAGIRDAADCLPKRVAPVTEISEGGSVPELKLFNESEASVLILDGEELEGAKQNRVLNTSLLVKGKSELLVPVSCTEQGRWSRVSEEFADSEKVLFRKARAKKMERVSESLKFGGGYQSDQGEIWSDISMAQADFNAYSPTSAMKHVYDAQKTTIDQYLGAFPIGEGQVGFIAGLGGRLAGMEYISRPECYAEVHKRLVESYALDCLRERHPEGEMSLAESQRFLEQIWSAKAESFPFSL